MVHCNSIAQARKHTYLPLNFAEFIAEGDEELPIPLLLVAGQCQDTCQVVALLAVLLLAEVTDLDRSQDGTEQQLKHTFVTTK